MDLDVRTWPWEEPWEEAADFFWDVYCRERTLEHLKWLAKVDFASVRVKAEPPDGELLGEEIERLGREHQEALSRISLLQAGEVAARVPYRSDEDEELNGRLHLYLHTAAALALLLRSVTGTLKRCVMGLKRLGRRRGGSMGEASCRSGNRPPTLTRFPGSALSWPPRR